MKFEPMKPAPPVTRYLRPTDELGEDLGVPRGDRLDIPLREEGLFLQGPVDHDVGSSPDDPLGPGL